jgi:hypothetical protein
VAATENIAVDELVGGGQRENSSKQRTGAWWPKRTQLLTENWWVAATENTAVDEPVGGDQREHSSKQRTGGRRP